MAPWLFTSAILDRRAIDVFNGGNMRRDFTYIDDIVSGVLAALDRPPSDDGSLKSGGSRAAHEIYNIGNSVPERLDEFIAAIEQACGKKARRNDQPMQPGDVPTTFADISAIHRDLGYKPTTPISKGIPRFVDWFRRYRESAERP